jgi:hypothetical protein
LHRKFIAPLVACLALVAAAPSMAGSARLVVETNEVYLGIPFIATIEVTADNDQNQVAPDFPKLNGADAEFQNTSQFSSSNFTITMNGKRVGGTETRTQYIYRVIPRKEGTLVIPPIAVQVDNATVQTSGVRLKVSKAETGDLMFLEINAPRNAIYLGEPLDVTLRILLQLYDDGKIRLDEPSMWSCIDKNTSSFGVFTEVLQRARDIQYGKISRKGPDGVEKLYTYFDLTTRLWPDRAGPLDVGQVRLACKYPLKVAPKRGFMGSQLELVQSKPIVGTLTEMPITVKPIPTDGRPPYYTGAVGLHNISASAAPINAHVGDPITLNITITGSGQMDSLQAPPLSSVPGLTQGFQIDDDQLAGRVVGNRKQFSPSVRARSTDVHEIPPIPFAYFDPAKERFVTVQTDPIALKILPSERLSTSQIVESGRSDQPPARQSLTEAGPGLEANYTDTQALLAQHAFGPGPGTMAALALPPLVYAATALLAWNRKRFVGDVALARRTAARRVATQRLRTAELNRSTHDAMTALLGYIADRLNVPAGGLTRDDAVARLSRAGLDATNVQNVDALLAEGELAEFAGAGVPVEALSGRVRDCIDRLEKVRL